MNARDKSKVVIVGASGLVGSTFVRSLERLPLKIDELVLFGSEKSAGYPETFKGKPNPIRLFDPSEFKDAKFVFFSGAEWLSEQFCMHANKQGAWVIDNSSVFRMKAGVPLVVPEINLHTIGDEPQIIANPNCSTIQLAVALAPIRDKYGLKRVIVSTYQSASGAGNQYFTQLLDDSRTFLETGDNSKIPEDSPAFNCHPDVGSPSKERRFSEETKLIFELRKILEMPDLPVCATAVRVPTPFGHGESVVIETEKPVKHDSVRRLLKGKPGIEVMDGWKNRSFPTPGGVTGTDEVWIGRIRKAGVFENDLAFWVVADNLLKGAAVNAIQIALYIQNRG